MARKERDTAFVVAEAGADYERSVRAGLMQATLRARDGKRVTLPNGREVVEFVNCSYLGLDQRPDVIAGAKKVLEDWGVHFCCARSRFSIEPNRLLEDGLSKLFRGRAITFPSVTTAHMSALPLVASGALLEKGRGRVRLIFDKFAHSSMQYLRPILAAEATVESIGHNALDQLAARVKDAHAHGETAVYVADGVYSMGGVCPVAELLPMSRELGFYLYLDDAHGTSIFGEQGEGYVVSQLEGALPENLFLTFSLAKGFGCNGGGVVVPGAHEEHLVRSFGQTYAFSGPLDFSIMGAALVSLSLHQDGTVRRLQEKLRENVALYDFRMGQVPEAFSPIRMVQLGDSGRAISITERLVEKGYFASVAFFPVVPANQSQLRVCITVDHTREQIIGMAEAIRESVAAVP